MRRKACSALTLLMIIAASGCVNTASAQGTEQTSTTAEQSAEQTSTTAEESTETTTEAAVSAETEEYDIDLSQLSNTIVYSEVYNMAIAPDSYIGKKIKVSGSFSVYQDPETDKCYYACLIADATSCCSQALEFVLEGDYKYPDDYPEAGAEITVSGEFDTYEENGYLYCQLIHARLEK